MSDANTDRPSGACTMPRRANTYDRLPGEVFAVEPHVSAASARRDPEHTRAIVVLPAPFEPSSASTRPGSSWNETLEQRAERSVAGIDTVELEERRRGAGTSQPRSHHVSEIGPAHRGVGEHVVGRAATRSTCRSRGRTPARRTTGRDRRRARRARSRSRVRAAPRRSVARERLGLGAVETRRRLVEQQQPRLGHQAPVRPRPGGRYRGSATRPSGRRSRRARAVASISAARCSSSRVGRTAPDRVLQQRRPDRCGPGRRRAGARAATSRRTARCVGTCGRCPAAPAGASARASRSLPSNVIVPSSGAGCRAGS